MIDELHVRNIALIREATLMPSPGLTVLTGETGAGKTALLSACKLLMGARADSAMVREGADQAQIEGRLFLANPETANENEEVVVTRKVSADGRSRASLNGSLASVSELARTVGPSIELCGQHEHQALLKPSEHGPLLDAWANLTDVAQAYRVAFQEVSQAQDHLDQVKDQANASHLQLEEARFTLKTIEAVNPQPGEYEELVDYLAKAEHAETLARNSHGAAEALSGDGGALDALNSAIALLDEASRADESLAPYASSLREICFVAEDVARDMATYCEDIDFDSATLAHAQERMGAFQGLLRSFGPTMDEVFARQEEAAELVALVDHADESIARAQAALDQAEEQLAAAAASYTASQQEAAPRFAQAVGAVMGQLEMGSAQIECSVEPLPRERWTRAGAAAVAFEFRPGKSMQARPLARIASGGEISRVMLAIKVVLGAQDHAGTLIFDEVDAGVGGSTATALAAVLAQLAESHQIIAITHLAQVAVAADTHYVVEKTKGDTPETLLRVVTGASREQEVARMLSGDATEASLAHAREMLS
ncbi:DNA repair protein RecN [uncultured Adlercreutzia sp.]|uniref:DNA repair protein RecN n=1 Tax=uncultured Adlercreutzia sp. TaxID=875803 RepID=UPI0025FB6E2D|nr:DNA repair protein RecN [uncultured Adlercreutzia sp.]MCI9262915.1 DNA repair protein RecN [Eggerthellaceae bacterium]